MKGKANSKPYPTFLDVGEEVRFDKLDKWSDVLIDETNLKFHEGLASVGIRGYYGAVNKAHKIVIPFNYSYLSAFRFKTAIVALKGDYYLINTNNRRISQKYDFLYYNGDGYRVYGKNGRFGILKPDGKELTENNFNWISRINNSSWDFLIGERWGKITKTGSTMYYEAPNLDIIK